MTFAEALFGMRGRSGGRWCILYGFICFPPLVIASGGLFILAVSGRIGTGAAVVAGALGTSILIAEVWIAVALGVKRLHDMDMSGIHIVWVLIGLMVAKPLAGVAGVEFLETLIRYGILIWLCCAPGTAGPNRYGEPDA